MLAAAPVQAGRGERVEGVRDGNDARAEWDLIAGETLGIAAAVEALVVVAHDRGDLRLTRRRHHRGAVGGVELDDRVLAVGELFGLVQDLPGGVDLAHVVQQGG